MRNLSVRERRAHVGAIVIDIDNLHELNEVHGEEVGDDVLRQAAKRILSAIRQVDAVGRFGGDEFLVVLSNCEGADEARLIAQNVHCRICETPIETCKGRFVVTASLGVASGTMGMVSFDKTLVDLADAALETARQNGRNRIATALINTQGDCKAAVA